MKEVIVRMNTDHIKVKGGEYVQDIVRCKECKHRTYCYSEVHMTNRKQTTSICKDIDFCSYGERRE